VAESKSLTFWTALLVIVTAVGVMIAWLEYSHKPEPQRGPRPALDVISAVVSERSNQASIEDGLESDVLQLTIKNTGQDEAANIEIETLTVDGLKEDTSSTLKSKAKSLAKINDILPGEQGTKQVDDVAQRVDGVRRALFNFRLKYVDRNDPRKSYDETSCFYTNQFEAGKHAPTDGTQNVSIPLMACERTFEAPR
jgi:hypothetical protein